MHSLRLDQDPNFDYERLVNSRTDEVSKAPIFGYDANSMTLYLKSIPKNVSRWELLDLMKESRGFISLSMSDALRSQDFERYAWISYDSDENCKQAKEFIESKSLHDGQVKLTPYFNLGYHSKILITPELPEDAIDRDLALCKKLIQEVFDQEKEIPADYFDKIQEFATTSGLSKTQHLDLLLLYLRKVHAYCLYCDEEFDDERTLAVKCGPAHLRNARKITRA